MPSSTCKAVTKTGQPCKLAPKGDSGFCWRHSKDSEGEPEAENTTEAADTLATDVAKTAEAGTTEVANEAEEEKKTEAEATTEAATATTTAEDDSKTTIADNNNSNAFKFDFSSMEVPREPARAPASSQDGVPSFKLVIAGDGAVGKSAFVERWISGGFLAQYEPTLGTRRNEILLNTNLGPVKLDIWDLAGQEQYGGLRDGYYIGAQAALLCFDVTNRTSYKNIPIWHKDITRVCESIPIVLLGMKADVGQKPTYESDAKGDNAIRTVMPSQVTFHRKKNMQYYEVSAKTFLNIDKPFTYLLQKLTGDPKITFPHNFNTPAEPSDEKEPVNVHATPGGSSAPEVQPSPFEVRFGSNPTALSFEPADKTDFSFAAPFSFGDALPLEFSSPFTMPKLQSPSTFSFDNPFTSATVIASATAASSAPVEGEKSDEVVSLTARFAGAAISGEKKSEAAIQRAALQGTSLQEFWAQEFGEGDEEGDPDYDPNLDEGDLVDEDWEGDEGDETEEDEEEYGQEEEEEEEDGQGEEFEESEEGEEEDD